MRIADLDVFARDAIDCWDGSSVSNRDMVRSGAHYRAILVVE